MKSRYRAYNNASIVALVCGSDQGTAFFVTEHLLLTARHILSDAVDNGDEISIAIGDYTYTCSIEWEGDDDNLIDLAILKCDGHICVNPLKLLALPPDRRDVDLKICGYPHENGGGRNQFEIPVTPTAKVNGREYDVITAPLALLSFVSFKGFSGSPVLNDSGSVVGVITDQLNSVLGYKSLASISEILAEQGLICSRNWEMEDLRSYGLGSAEILLKKQVELAGDRFNEDVHVDNNPMIHKLERFTSKKHFVQVKSDLNKLEQVYVEYTRTLPEGKMILDWYNNPYEIGSYINLSFFLRKALQIAEKDPRQNKEKQILDLRDALDKVDDCLTLYNEVDGNDYVIDGEAGSGKTHLVCWFALHHQSPCYVYLIHGAQLTASEDIEQQICRLCLFPDSTLAALDEKMLTVEKYGVIIIDAINECSLGSFWLKRLDVFRDTFKKYKNLKLIITLRTGTLNVYGYGRQQTISGFESVPDAVDRYFKAYGVPSDFDWKKFKGNFKNPLFLKLFCDSFRYLNGYWRTDLKQIDVYLAYIKKRNEKISELVDEDIFRNVSEKYLLKIASYSLYYRKCLDVSREKARRLGDGICPGRLWSQSLLKNTLDENLLISMPDYDFNEEVVGFHFEKMGDFLRAYVLLNSKTDSARKVQQLEDLLKAAKGDDECEGKFRGLIGAFIGTYDGDHSILDHKAFTDGPLREYLVEALPYKTEYSKDIIVLLLKSMTPALIRALVVNFNDYDEKEILALHEALLDMTLPQRDLVWSEAINEFCDIYGFDFSSGHFNIANAGDRKRVLVLLSWLLCTSYPEARACIIRKLYVILRDEPKSCVFILKAMIGCDDPYVIEGVLCSVYGVVISSRDAALVSKIAGWVRTLFYGDKGQGPMNIKIRSWTLKILERDHYLTPRSKFFDECTPPCNTSSPFDHLNAKEKAADNKNFFGKTQGAVRLYKSLFGLEDFARYIIGTNSSLTNPYFLYKNSEDEVLLSDIQEMVAQRIMEMGWNDALGEYDNRHYSPSRFNNKKERLGKKYQWLAYYDILGQLSDHCDMKDPWSHPFKKLGKSYPWYTSEINCFDPTLEENVKSIGQLVYKSPFGIDPDDGIEWVRNNEVVPELCFDFLDQEETEWVRLYGYESEDVKQQDGLEIEGFLFYNSHFVKAGDVSEVVEWAKKKNFYGRWMREAPSLYEFLWNEYPWSDSYKSMLKDGEWEDGDLPVKTMRSAIIQLQEDKRGLDSDDYISNAYLPCADMMEVLNLYTAERGIIRAIEDNDIVAASFRQLGVKNGGIAIKKKYLGEYLKITGYKLFYFIMGEKLAMHSIDVTSDGLKELSACWYLGDDGWHEVQHLTVCPSRSSLSSTEDEEDFTWLDEFMKKNPNVEFEDESDIKEEK